jgi:hypothetical protein
VKKILMMAALVAASFSVQAGCRMQHGDDLKFDGDKRAHATWSGVGAIGVEAADAVLDLDLSAKTKWLIVMAPGLLREIKTGCGSDTRGGFSWQDVVYNGIGAAVGLGVGHGVRVLLTPRSVHIHWEL